MLGIISTLLPFALYTMGLSHMETSRASILTFIEPVCAALISIFVFHEPFGINHAIGMIAIIGSVSILNINFKGRKQYHTDLQFLILLNISLEFAVYTPAIMIKAPAI